MKLTGNWETMVGEQDVFCTLSYHSILILCSLFASLVHILEYENYSGYDKTIQKIRTSQVGTYTRRGYDKADHSVEFSL